MEITCEECKKKFTKPAGWGLETCLHCFNKTLANFVKEMEKESAVENITIYQGNNKIVVKGEN